MSWLEFVGEIEVSKKKVVVDVKLRGELLGQVFLDLDQWDDLRGMRNKNDLRWLEVIALKAKA